MKMTRLPLAATLAFMIAAPACVARPLDAIKRDGTLRVGMTGDYAPFSVRSGDGPLHGADVEMAQSLAKVLNVTLVLVPTTWKSLAADLDADRFDIAMGGVSVTPDRAAAGDFSVPVLSDGKRPIVRCGDKDRFVSVEAIDRPEVRVAVNPGGTNERFAKSHFAHSAMTIVPDNRTIFDDVAKGEADVMVTDGVEVDYQSRRHPGVLCPAAVPDTFDHADKAYWMKRDPALKQAIDTWLQELLTRGDYRRALAATATE